MSFVRTRIILQLFGTIPEKAEPPFSLFFAPATEETIYLLFRLE